MTVEFDIVTAGDGSRVVTLNGKPFTLERGYEHDSVDGVFFMVLSGKQRLFWDDIGEYWKVEGSKGKYIAFAQRPFSYHLCQGEDAEIPLGVSWPRLQSTYGWYAIVGLTEDAIKAQAKLLMEQYRPGQDWSDVRVIRVPDKIEGGIDAWLIQL